MPRSTLALLAVGVGAGLGAGGGDPPEGLCVGLRATGVAGRPSDGAGCAGELASLDTGDAVALTAGGATVATGSAFSTATAVGVPPLSADAAD
jgi:hypothetical protein